MLTVDFTCRLIQYRPNTTRKWSAGQGLKTHIRYMQEQKGYGRGMGREGRGRKPTLACMVPLQQCMLELTGSQTQYEHPSIKTNTGNVTPTSKHCKQIINCHTGLQCPNHSVFTQTVITAECFKMRVRLPGQSLE